MADGVGVGAVGTHRAVAAGGCLAGSAAPPGRSWRTLPLQAANLLWILAGVSAVTVGAVLASRRPSHPVGWLLLVVGLPDQSDGLISNYVHYGVMARPGGLPAAGYLSGFYNSGTILMVACISFVALLTPTGGLPSPRWRWTPTRWSPRTRRSPIPWPPRPWPAR
jgi:hypothetical protein